MILMINDDEMIMAKIILVLIIMCNIDIINGE